jgi:hypothetical protein
MLLTSDGDNWHRVSSRNVTAWNGRSCPNGESNCEDKVSSLAVLIWLPYMIRRQLYMCTISINCNDDELDSVSKQGMCIAVGRLQSSKQLIKTTHHKIPSLPCTPRTPATRATQQSLPPGVCVRYPPLTAIVALTDPWVATYVRDTSEQTRANKSACTRTSSRVSFSPCQFGIRYIPDQICQDA